MGKNYSYLYKIGDVVNETLKIIDFTKNKQNKKSYIVCSLVFEDAPHYEVRETDLKNGAGCAYSRKVKSRIFEGNSLWSIEKVKNHIIDVEESKKLSPHSNKIIRFKCANTECNNTKKMKPNDLVNQGYGCTVCSTSLSYGELAFISYSKYYNLGYDSEVVLKSLPKRRFDFLNFKTRQIVEIQGEQHTNKNHRWYKHSHMQDIEKREFAKNNGYNLIEIDMSISNWGYFKEQINKCEYLPSIDSKSDKAIQDIMNSNGHYPVEKIINMYTVDKKSLSYIGKKYKLDAKKVADIIKRNGIEVRGTGGARKIMCVNTGEVFNSLIEASKKYNTSVSNIGCALSPKINQKTAGKNPITGESLIWQYID